LSFALYLLHSSLLSLIIQIFQFTVLVDHLVFKALACHIVVHTSLLFAENNSIAIVDVEVNPLNTLQIKWVSMAEHS